MKDEDKTKEQLIYKLEKACQRINELENSEIEHKKAEEALNKRIIALTEPLDTADISFTDLFDINEIQKIQDTFAQSSNVASIITYPDGTPITKPSNFCRLCNDVIRKTEKGLANCFYSDSVIGKHNLEGPNIQLCLSGGLWDAGASITVGGKHIANWMIGQVKNEAVDEENIIQYADVIGADEDEFRSALYEVPVMSVEQFQNVAEVLFILANELSIKAYQNIQQARFIAERKHAEKALQEANVELEQIVEERIVELKESNEQLKEEIEEHKFTEKALRESEERFRLFYENSPLPYQSLDSNGCFIEVNQAFLDTIGYTKEEIIGRSFWELMTSECMYKFKESFPRFKELGYVRNAEFELLRKDNTQITVLVDGNIEYTLDGTFKQTHCVWSDITDRKLWEEALIESEDRYRFLYEYNPSMYFTVDAEGTVLSVNQFGAEQLGYTVHELVGRSVLQVFHEDDKEAAAGNVKRCVKNQGHLFHWELRKIRKDGSMLWVKETARAVRGTDDEIKVLIVCEDITELKELENALKESEMELKAIIESSPDAIVVTDLRGNIMDCNQTTLDLHNFNLKEELIGSSAVNLIALEDRERIAHNMKKIVSKGSLKDIEYTALTKKGHKFPIEFSASVIWDNSGKPRALVGVAKDITERKAVENALREAHDNLELKVQERTKELSKCNIRLESDIGEIKRIGKALRESEEKFRALAENSPDIISRLDKELRYKYVNHGSKTLGLSSENLIGKKLEEIAPLKGITKIWVENARKVFNTGEMQEMEFEFPSIHGLKIFHSYMVPEYDEIGEIESLLVVSHDVTSRKQLEEELKETVEELKRSNEELQQFAYVASHDLQEPLRTITSFTQLLERRYKDKLDSDADEFIGYIVDAAKRMQTLIKDLLNYSRVATGGTEFELTDTEEILRSALNNLNTAICENNAEITYENLPEVIADSGQILQLFQNLIGNAIKFRKPEIPPKIHISAVKDENKNEYTFAVSDNGIGMEPQYAERVFTIFQRLHTREEYDGTGIGLAISKRVAERHGGRIWTESKFGKGSTFYFVLPAK